MAGIFIKRSFIPASVRAIVPAFLFLIGIVGLTLIVLKIGYERIAQGRSQVEQISKDQNTLKAKESLLREVQGSAISQANSALSAVPSKNPFLAVVSQLKNIAIENGLTLSGVKGGGQSIDSGKLATTSINFRLSGTTSSIFDFLKAVTQASPLTTVEKVTLTHAGGTAEADISVKAYWASFPEKIPSVTEPVSSLTSDEKNLLSKIEKLTPPPYTDISPSAPTIRSDPFSL